MDLNLDWVNDDNLKELINRFQDAHSAGLQSFFDVDDFEAIIDFYLDSGMFNEANAAVEIAMEQHPSANGFQIRYARVLGNSKKYYEALEMLNNIELVESTNIDVYLSKAEIYSLMNKHEMAIAEYKRALNYTDNKEDLFTSMAFEYENLSDYDNAIKYLKLAIDISPESENLIHEISFFFEITGREEEAIVFFNDFVDSHPYSKLAWFNLGVFYNSVELYEKAIEAYEFVLAIDDTFSSAYFAFSYRSAVPSSKK